LQTSAVLGQSVAPIVPLTIPMTMPVQPPAGLSPVLGWPGSGMGLPWFGGTYELTKFEGPETTMPGPLTLKASGGEYDSCANDYSAKATVQSQTMEIRLAVSVTSANRQCFASGYAKTHTFEFPLRLDTPGAYAVMAQTAQGGYRRIGSVTVKNGQIDPGPGNGQFTYEFTSFDGPHSAQRGVTVTVKASGGEYDFCGASFSPQATINAQAKTLDLSLIGTPHPPDQPRCMALATNHTESFDVRFGEAGLYTVRTNAASGWKSIGNMVVN
jgi:hypothetical protein